MVYARLLKPKQPVLANPKRIACDGKKQFRTKTDAETTLRNLRRYKGLKDRLHPYHCNYCGGWHLGSGEPQDT